MVRETRYQELFRIATEQLLSISDSISKKQEDEVENAKRNNKELNHTFYRIESRGVDHIKFSVGLQKFIVKMEISLPPNSEFFSLKTYEITDNMEDYGKLKLIPKPELNVTGNFIMFMLAGNTTKHDIEHQKVGTMYLTSLLALMDGKTNFDFSFV